MPMEGRIIGRGTLVNFCCWLPSSRNNLSTLLYYLKACMNQGDNDRLTLQQYLQTYNIRKKIQERKRSKSRSKDPLAIESQKQKTDNIFATMDAFLEQTKVQLEDILINTEIKRDRIFFYVAKLLDDLMVRLKDEIVKMYKDVYHHYRIENSEAATLGKKETEQYFKDKMVHAIEEKKHSNMAEVVKENFKKQEKNAFITKLILGQNVDTGHTAKSPLFTDNNIKSNIQGRQKMPKQKTQVQKQTINPQKNHQAKEQPASKQTNTLTVPTNHTKKVPQTGEKRANSFFEALFGLSQKGDSNSNTTASVNASPAVKIDEEKSPKIKENPIPSQKGSKIARPFQRKTSIKEIMNSPKGKRMLKAVSPK